MFALARKTQEKGHERARGMRAHAIQVKDNIICKIFNGVSGPIDIVLASHPVDLGSIPVLDNFFLIKFLLPYFLLNLIYIGKFWLVLVCYLVFFASHSLRGFGQRARACLFLSFTYECCLLPLQVVLTLELREQVLERPDQAFELLEQALGGY